MNRDLIVERFKKMNIDVHCDFLNFLEKYPVKKKMDIYEEINMDGADIDSNIEKDYLILSIMNEVGLDQNISKLLHETNYDVLLNGYININNNPVKIVKFLIQNKYENLLSMEKINFIGSIIKEVKSSKKNSTLIVSSKIEDLLFLSDLTNSWYSCHTFSHQRWIGNVHYALDDKTIVGYQIDRLGLKEWRELAYLYEDNVVKMVYFSREFPSSQFKYSKNKFIEIVTKKYFKDSNFIIKDYMQCEVDFKYTNDLDIDSIPYVEGPTVIAYFIKDEKAFQERKEKYMIHQEFIGIIDKVPCVKCGNVKYNLHLDCECGKSGGGLCKICNNCGVSLCVKCKNVYFNKEMRKYYEEVENIKQIVNSIVVSNRPINNLSNELYICNDCVIKYNCKQCENCGNIISKFVEIDNKSICEKCIENYYSHCNQCNSIIKKTTMRSNDFGDNICLKCFELNYFACECGRNFKLIDKNGLIQYIVYNSVKYCKHCKNKYFVKCNECGNYISRLNDNIYINESKIFCEKCKKYNSEPIDSSKLYICIDCGSLITSMFIRKSNQIGLNNIYCKNCYNKYYDNCKECNDVAIKLDLKTYFGKRICNRCYQSVLQCNGCNKRVVSYNPFLINEKVFCKDCYNKFYNKNTVNCINCKNTIDQDNISILLIDKNLYICNECVTSVLKNIFKVCNSLIVSNIPENNIGNVFKVKFKLNDDYFNFKCSKCKRYCNTGINFYNNKLYCNICYNKTINNNIAMCGHVKNDNFLFYKYDEPSICKNCFSEIYKNYCLQCINKEDSKLENLCTDCFTKINYVKCNCGNLLNVVENNNLLTNGTDVFCKKCKP